MSLNSDELQVVISANANQFHGELLKIQEELKGLNVVSNQVSSSTEQVSKSIGGNLTGSIIKANIFTSIFSKGLGIISDSMGGFIDDVISGGSSLARAETVVNRLAINAGISKDQLGGMRDALRDANTEGTAAEDVIKSLVQTGLVPLAQNLETVDGRTGKAVHGLSALVLEMKDISAAGEMSSAEGIKKITDFIYTGDSGMVDGLIQVQNLDVAYQSYAQKILHTTRQLTEYEKSIVRLNIVEKAGIQDQGAYADSLLSSGKVWESVQMKYQTLTQTLGSFLEPIFSVVAQGFFQFVNGVQSALNSNAKSITDWATSIAGYVVATIRLIGSLLSTIPVIGSAFKSMATFTLSASKATTSVGAASSKTAKDVGYLNQNVQDLNASMAQLASFDEMNVLSSAGAAPTQQPAMGQGLDNGIGGSILDVDTINKKANEVQKDFDNIGKTITEIWNKVTGFISGIVSFGTVISNIAGFIKTTWDIVTSVLSMASQGWAIIFGFIGEVVTNFSKFMFSVGENVRIVFNAVLDVIGHVWKAIVDAAVFIKDAVVNNIVHSFNMIKDTVINVWNTITSVLGGVWSWLTTNVGKAFENVRNVITGAWNGVMSKISDGWNWITGVLGGVWNWLVQNVSGAFENVKNRVSDAWNGLGNIVNGVWNGIQNGIKTGINGVIGLINNFIHQINDLIGKVNDIGEKLPIPIPKIGFHIGDIPQLAMGGIINTPTLAMIGEAGKEAVMPLENNTGWINELAAKINSSNTSNGQQIIVKIGEATIYKKFVEYLNDQTKTKNSFMVKI